MPFHNHAQREQLSAHIKQILHQTPSRTVEKRAAPLLTADMQPLTEGPSKVGVTCDFNLLNASQSQIDWTKYYSAIRLPEVLEMSGLSRSGWYALINPKSPAFDEAAPAPFKDSLINPLS